ncbi:MAG TPA: proline--tRNA ligase [Spirochaetota bacterium]|jgi:prolyl-tRNA synthetase|nr:MAG: Proline--tRNA ligase [Spirochaetes bacterium ADurb.Bin133]HNZ26068.1 proline--tRNA ligase [Spirochaetota bacterium]HPY86541.1 proline--tRNA ligase [Spirochaetota bacterium]HQB60837.1 proline--tRNA ligase [Spirochaetota bacterium]
MLLSKYFFKTIKEIPNDAELKSHRLLIRGGYIKQVSAGIFSYMPMAVRVFRKIENIIREEMNAVDGFEVNMPVALPAALWSETGRYEAVGDELLKFEDRTGRKMLLAMTHEEAVTDLARYVVNSYKQLPLMLYQIQTKFRDEPRVRGGLIRAREFVMKDAYSFHTDEESLNGYYDRVHKAYENIFRRCGLSVVSVASDVGMMGGSGAHEFMALVDSGEDTIILCNKCDYKANKEVAKAKRDYLKEETLPPEMVVTPNKATIEEVSSYLNITPSQTLKAVVYSVDNKIVLCAIRGDLEINETKLKNYLKVKNLVFASDEELAKNGIVKGFTTPVGLSNVRIIVDESVALSSNLVAGSNKKDYHTKNINFGRDFTTKEIVDISSVKDGEKCPLCGAPLSVERGIEVGNIFKLGTKYSKAMKSKYLDEQGKDNDIVMGCYGIGVGRLMASVVEATAHEKQIIWPIPIAPFAVELVGIFKDTDADIMKLCLDLYKELSDKGIEVLYDDRIASAGIKLNDADLIGSPIRINIGSRSLANGGAEISINGGEPTIVALNKIANVVSYNLKS